MTYTSETLRIPVSNRFQEDKSPAYFERIPSVCSSRKGNASTYRDTARVDVCRVLLQEAGQRLQQCRLLIGLVWRTGAGHHNV